MAIKFIFHYLTKALRLKLAKWRTDTIYVALIHYKFSIKCFTFRMEIVIKLMK